MLARPYLIKNKFWERSITFSTQLSPQNIYFREESVETIVNSLWCNNGRYIYLESDFFIAQDNLNQQDYEKQKNIYYETHDPEFVITVRSFTLNFIDWTSGNWY